MHFRSWPRHTVTRMFKPKQGSADAVLLLIALAAAVPRIYLGATQFIEYDGYWHVFIAMQDDWEIFQREYQANFHPPLFYLLLKGALWFGPSALVYRAIPILAGVAAVFLTGRITKKLSLWGPTPAIAALACGFALPSIIVSLQVRSYMLCVFFVLASFYFFLDLLDGQSHAKSRIAFALFAILAACSHYTAFFYVFACALVAGAFAVLSSRRQFLRRSLLDLATFAPVAGAVALLYYAHTQEHAIIAAHLRSFYFDPAGGESIRAFLFRNAQSLFNLFSPLDVTTQAQFIVVLSGFTLAGGCAVYLLRIPLPENTRATAAIGTGVLILGSIVGAAILGKYPFGGHLRQQFILFPFAIVCGSILCDRGARAIGGQRLRSSLAAAAVLLTVGFSAVRFHEFPKISTELGSAHMARFRRLFPSPPVVYVDQFNLITFFTHHHDWNWRFLESNPGSPAFDIYRVSKGPEQFLLLRDRVRWNSDFADPALYADLAAAFQLWQLPNITMFWTSQVPEPVSIDTETTMASRAIELASAANLCVNKLSPVGSLSTYIEFADGPCPREVDPVTACRDCDDANWRISFSGNWERGVFEGPAEQTLTYTMEVGAVARAAFAGSAVTYVYTKAYNRGLAAIVVDGVQKAVVDQASPEIEWQASTTIDGLAPGNHTIEIRALGRPNPMPFDVYIDVDAIRAP